MSKFSVGEIAVYVGPCKGTNSGAVAPWSYGSEVEISGVVPEAEKKNYRMNQNKNWYYITGHRLMVAETSLRKRPQQDDNLFTEWAKSHLITDLDLRPTETQVREGLKNA